MSGDAAKPLWKASADRAPYGDYCSTHVLARSGSASRALRARRQGLMPARAPSRWLGPITVDRPKQATPGPARPGDIDEADRVVRRHLILDHYSRRRRLIACLGVCGDGGILGQTTKGVARSVLGISGAAQPQAKRGLTLSTTMLRFRLSVAAQFDEQPTITVDEAGGDPLRFLGDIYPEAPLGHLLK
jgi:hypothetical protein